MDKKKIKLTKKQAKEIRAKIKPGLYRAFDLLADAGKRGVSVLDDEVAKNEAFRSRVSELRYEKALTDLGLEILSIPDTPCNHHRYWLMY